MRAGPSSPMVNTRLLVLILAADDINATIHAHPTLAEMDHETVLAPEGRPIHI